MATKTTVSCPVCGYPLSRPASEEQSAICAYCGTNLISQEEGVTIPTPLFVGMISFLAGMLLGPSIIATTSGGRDWLERRAREAVK